MTPQDKIAQILSTADLKLSDIERLSKQIADVVNDVIDDRLTNRMYNTDII